MTEHVSNDFSTTLAAAITTADQTSISVVSATGSPDVNFRIRIGDEWMLVEDKGAGTNWTVVRGIEGSTPTTHLNGADVSHVLTVGGLDALRREAGMLHVVDLVPANFKKLVPANHRFTIFEGLEVNGELVVEGEVLIL